MMKPIITEILVNLKYKYSKNKKITNNELRLLKNYVSKSNLFKGEKKKIYTQISKYKL